MEITLDRTFVSPLCNFSGLSPLNCGQLTSRPLDTPREEAVAMPWYKCILHASLRRAMNRARLRLLVVSSRLAMFEDLSDCAYLKIYLQSFFATACAFCGRMTLRHVGHTPSCSTDDV